MEYYKDILCVTASELIRFDERRGIGCDTGFMTYNTYDSNRKRGNLKVVRPGKGLGCPALIEFESMRQDLKQKYVDIYGDPRTEKRIAGFQESIVIDTKARSVYASYRSATGGTLPPRTIQEYTINASILNTLKIKLDERRTTHLKLRGRVSLSAFWSDFSAEVNRLKGIYNHTLPETPSRLKKKLSDYENGGYEALINGKFGNSNTRKVSMRIERLLMALYCMDNKPYTNTVAELYMQFLLGKISVCDKRTGEIYQPADFCDKDGNFIILSESTIWNYLTNPRNQLIMSKMRGGADEYRNKFRPYHTRKSPLYAFSKISLDDRDLPRKLHDGTRVKAYYAYDVASQCIIGYSYSRLKDKDLFIDCIRDMFRLIYRQGFGMPAEIEVEHHLVNNFTDGLMKAGEVFPLIRWCNAGNSQEKRAEHFNRLKKYTVEKSNHKGIGRWWLRLQSNRTVKQKVFDEKNNTYKEPTYDYDALVADDIADIMEYNAQPHSDQKRYRGMSRWEVLCEKQNPDLQPIDKAIITRYIGKCCKTSVRRSKFIQVQYTKYGLPHVDLMRYLSPNNYEVQAYYLPDENGIIDEVFIYQNERFICRAGRVEGYNEARVEQTDADRLSYLEQSEYVAQVDRLVREERPEKVVIISEKENRIIQHAFPKLLPDTPVLVSEEYDDLLIGTDYSKRALNAL